MVSLIEYLGKEGLNQKQEYEPDHEQLGPSCVRPLYKNQPDEEHVVLGPVYQRPQLKGEYDHLLFHDQQAQSQRFGRLKPEVVFRLLGERRKYTYLKKFAVERLEETIHKQLAILHNLYKCDKYSKEPEKELSHNVFSWFMNDFLKRRRLRDFVWVDVLQRTSEPCLNVYKFKQDVEQLQKFLRRMFEGLLSNMGTEEIDINGYIVKPINNAKRVLEISQHIEQELEENNLLLKELRLKDSVFANIKRDSLDKMTKIFLETKILNNDIWEPIEVRYQLSWYNSKVNQLQYRLENMEESRQRDIGKYQQMTASEMRVSGCCMDFYYSSLESIKSRIVQMQAKFDNEYEVIEDRLAYKRAHIVKLRDQRKFLTEEILRFHEEIELMRIREEREKEQRDIKRLEEEALSSKKGKRGKVEKKGQKANKNNKNIGPTKSKAPTNAKGPKKYKK